MAKLIESWRLVADCTAHLECQFAGMTGSRKHAFLWEQTMPALLALSKAGEEGIADDNLTNQSNEKALDELFCALGRHAEGTPAQLRALKYGILRTVCQAAAWNVASLANATFVHSTACVFRVGIHEASEGGLHGKVSEGRIDIHIPQNLIDTMTEPSLIVAMAEYGVFASHFMHDVLIAEALEAGEKEFAGALAAASISAIANLLDTRISQFTNGSSRFGKLYGYANCPVKNTRWIVTDDRAINQQTDYGIVVVKHDRPINPEGHCVLRQTLDGGHAEIKTIAKTQWEEYQIALAQSPYRDSAETFEWAAIRDSKQPACAPWDTLDTAPKPIKIDYQRSKAGILAIARAMAELLKLEEPEEDENGKSEGDGEGESEDQQPGGASTSSASALDMVAGDSGEGEAQGAGAGQGTPSEGDSGEGGEGDPNDGKQERENNMINSGAGNEEAQRIMQMLAVHDVRIQEPSIIGWRDLLYMSITRALGMERVNTWTRPNRRFAGDGLYLPGFKRKRVNRLAIFIDESGSIDLPKLVEFNEEISRVVDDIAPAGIDVFHFSTGVVEESFAQGEEWIARRLVNGGTNFSAPILHLEAHTGEGYAYDAVICFTDMENEGRDWGHTLKALEHLPPGVQMFWVVPGFDPRHAPEYGTVLDMNTGDMIDYNPQYI